MQAAADVAVGVAAVVAAVADAVAGEKAAREGSGDSAAQAAASVGSYDAVAQGAARFGFFEYPEPVTAADANLNRGVDIREFRAAAEKRFALLDKRNDGRLTRDELPKLALGTGGPGGGRPGWPGGPRTGRGRRDTAARFRWNDRVSACAPSVATPPSTRASTSRRKPNAARHQTVHRA